jgi:UDP-3-O-[3-hydroxymyristoyl] glucosamine N-acyltransferase
MKFTAQEIAAQLEGTVDGDPNEVVSKVSKIEEALPGSLTFLANPKYTPHIYRTKASIVIVNNSFVADNPIDATLVRVDDAYGAFTSLLDFYNSQTHAKTGVHASAIIDDTAALAANCYVGAHSVIEGGSTLAKGVKVYPRVFIGENVHIGSNTVIFPGATILSETQIGADCVIHSGCVIGADGFGFAPQENGEYQKIPQTGNVIIGNRVEIGANSTIDKATLGATRIADGVKLDNQIQIAHNVEIGENTVMAAQSGVAGSSKVGKNCVIGGQVGIVGHITIGDGTKIQGQSGVISNVAENSKLQGTPAIDYHSYNKSYVHFKNLPTLIKKIDSKDD